MRNIKLVIEYDGTAYNGWQRQADVLTIQQVMEDTLSRIVNDRVVLVASSRTDTGVHALNQVANFRTSSKLPLRNLHLGVNSLLPPLAVQCPGQGLPVPDLQPPRADGARTRPVLARAQAP